jgi:hypothetical protein
LKSRNAGNFHPLPLAFSIPIALLESTSSSVWQKTDVAAVDDMTELALADRLKQLHSKKTELRCELFQSIELGFPIILVCSIRY